MKTKLFALIGLLILLITSIAAAQDTEAPCATADVLATEYRGMVQGEWLQTVITTLNANIEDNDTTNFLGTARELRRVLARLESNCRGLHFTNESEGMEPVIGPVSIASGIWRATFTTAGFGSVKLDVISGTCEDDGLIFNAFEGDAADGMQSVVTTGPGCEVLISVSNTSEDWDLMFEAVKLDE
jgi:hypothetical protein